MPLQRSRIVQNHAPTLGRRTDLSVALLPSGSRAKPAEQILTVATAGAAKGATSISVDETIAAVIAAGQWLCFADTNGKEYLARVTTQVSSGSEIAVAALAEAIPADAVAEFPAYLWDRSAADIDRSYNLSTTATFNTGGARDGVITGNEKGITTPGIFYHYNAGYKTAKYAADEGLEVWLRCEYPAPNSAFSKGSGVEGPAVVTAAPSASPVDGNISADLTFAWLGVPTEFEPTPTA